MSFLLLPKAMGSGKCTLLHIPHYNIIQHDFITLKNALWFSYLSSLSFEPLEITNLFTISTTH